VSVSVKKNNFATVSTATKTILPERYIMTSRPDFDRIIERHNSNSYKYDKLRETFGTTDLLPMWVADMDFASPDFILDAIRARCDHGILGYTLTPKTWSDAITSWLYRRHGWTVEGTQLGFIPGIVSGLALAIQCFTQPGDKVLVQSPVYPPFLHLPVNNGRELVTNSLVFDGQQFQIDFDDFERKAADCKLFILCNPHNPGGRVWSVNELERMCEICVRNGVLIVSDEIHIDLTLPGYTSHSPGSFTPEIASQVITLMAPSKTFNIPGLSSSFYVIQNDRLRKQFKAYLDKAELGMGNLFAILAAQAAFEHGDAWLDQLLAYLANNIAYIDNALKADMPRIKACIPQASYLIWLDCRELGLDDEALNAFFIKEAKLGLNPGTSFGVEGSGFMRMNIGCPKATVELAMNQLKAAYKARF